MSGSHLPRLSTDELILAIRQSLKTAQNRIRDAPLINRSSDHFWTNTIKEELCNAGHGLRFYTCATVDSRCADYGEWLYDLCWLDYGSGGFSTDSEKRQLQSVALAMESEWKAGDCDLLDDFEKLLQATAQLKLMIFLVKEDGDFEKRCAFLESRIKNYPDRSQDDYLLVGFADDSTIDFERKVIGPSAGTKHAH